MANLPRLLRLALIGACLLAILILGGGGLWFLAERVAQSGRVERRQAWLDSAGFEAELQIRGDWTEDRFAKPEEWLETNSAVFDDGFATYRVHTFHEDEPEASSWGGVGDLAILADNRGRRLYSRAHFCDGTIPWAIAPEGSAHPRRPANLEAFVALFKAGTWTADRTLAEAALARAAR